MNRYRNNRTNQRTVDDCACNNYCNLHQINTMNSNPLAMAYVPWQYWQEPLEPYTALETGTIFEELNLPFTGRRF